MARRKKTDNNIADQDDRRAHILRVAATLFKERGYSGTTVREIGNAVGLTSGALFHHFTTKEEILLGVVAAGIQQCIDLLNHEIAMSTPPRDRLRGMIRAHLKALLEGSPETQSIMFYEWWSLSPGARERLIALRDQYEALWRTAFAELSSQAGVKGKTGAKRLLLIGAMNWSTQWYRPQGPLDVDQIADELVAIFFPQAEPARAQTA